jgi:glutamate---cysteine ligase / carboxylate-amine ligase
MYDAYTCGIEEEYFLVDAESKAPAPAVPEAFLAGVAAATSGQVRYDHLRSVIRAATVRHRTIAHVRSELRNLRRTIAGLAAEHGLAILAAGSHPTAPAAEPDEVDERELDRAGRGQMLCGLHVHVELPDPDDRVDVMTRMLPYLPLFVALSTSSPFWQARRTGFKGYRLTLHDELPRSGVPELLRTPAEYRAYISALQRAGVIEDSRHVWWAIRPSLQHPTLELRAPDCCTRIEDSIAVAALYRVLARRLVHNPWLNWDITPVTRALVVENKWRAQRFGLDGTFIDEAIGTIPITEQLDRVITELRRDAEALGCWQELERCRAIAGAGTSADAQLRVFEAANDNGDGPQAMQAVTEWIANATLQ